MVVLTYIRIFLQIEDVDTDGVDEIYTPLERPHLPMVLSQPVSEPSGNLSDRYEASSDSSSDSDSDQHRPKVRRHKRKTRPTTPVSQPSKRKVNNSWISEATADVLSDKLNNCKVEKSMFNSRDVESYHPGERIGQRIFQKSAPVHSNREPSNKRHRSGKGVSFKRKDFKNRETEIKEIERAPRLILPLSMTVNDSEEDLARDIANKLMEEKETVICKYHIFK